MLSFYLGPTKKDTFTASKGTTKNEKTGQLWTLSAG